LTVAQRAVNLTLPNFFCAFLVLFPYFSLISQDARGTV